MRILERYEQQVEKAAAGGLQLSQVGPEVVPPLEQFNPVSSGVFDLLFSHGAFTAAATGCRSGWTR